MGIDLGSRRVGLAVSESGLLARPCSVLQHWTDESDLIRRISEMAADLQVERFVAGIPRTLRSDRFVTAARFEHFAEALRRSTGREVVLWDETLTTVAAEERMRAAGVPARKRAARIDMEAATVILQTFLDEQRRRTS